MPWKPTNQPNRYDKARVATLRPIGEAIERLHLPLNRFRKLRGILGALEMQVEDGGDSPAVNEHLLAALRAALLHQVGPEQAQPALSAVDAFADKERLRWQQMQAGTLPPIDVPPDEEMDDLVHEAYRSMNEKHTAEACDRWLAAWEIAKTLITPQMRSTVDFAAVYADGYYYFRDWCSDLMYELHNAGLDDAAYATKRLVFVQEFRQRFPNEDAHTQCEFFRGEGEALWRLGRQPEAEVLFASAIEQLPDEAWLYIGWADQYWLWDDSPSEYARAEAILRRALARDTIDRRQDVLERLHDLYERWGKPHQVTEAAQELAVTSGSSLRSMLRRVLPAPKVSVETSKPQSEAPPKRNAPCWCGSGKKYKHCHMKADRR